MYKGTSRINIGLSVEQCACPLRLRRDSSLNRQSARSVSAAQTPRRYQPATFSLSSRGVLQDLRTAVACIYTNSAVLLHFVVMMQTSRLLCKSWSCLQFNTNFFWCFNSHRVSSACSLSLAREPVYRNLFTYL